MHCVTLEQVFVWCPRRSLTTSVIQRWSQHQCAYNWPINQFATLWELLKTFQ
jgi:hypothetical protein